jgi:tetratricopeptide (TPR) repeat protein
MSRTLKLCEHLLYEGRRFWTLGVDRRALRTFGHLAVLPDLPSAIAEETHLRLAELLLKQRKFAKARRHLALALAHEPASPECHYLLASSHAEDSRGDRKLAIRHYRRSLQLDPENALYLCGAGLFAVGCGEVEQGLEWLRRAVELAPDDAEVIGDVVHGLQEHGHVDEAMCIARAAFFRNSRNPGFQRLWNDFRFQQLRERQERIQKRRTVRRAVAEGRICLPFLKLTVDTPAGRKLVRRDGPSGTPPPHLRQLARLSRQKHA